MRWMGNVSGISPDGGSRLTKIVVITVTGKTFFVAGGGRRVLW